MRTRAILLTMAFGALAACAPDRSDPGSAGSAAASTRAPAPEPLVIGESFTIDSRVMGEPRRINVFVPTAYGEKFTTPLPVLYMLDGGLDEDFLHIAGLVQVLVSNNGMRPFMLVGIQNTSRRRDMTGPTQSAEDRKIAPVVGGSATFRRFIREELMPTVRARYGTTDETAIIGESLAGLFVMETFFLEPQLFSTYIAIDPSLWWNNEGLMKAAATRLGDATAGRESVFVASSSDHLKLGDRLAGSFDSHRSGSVAFHYAPLPAETHATIYHPAALLALRTMFASSTDPLPRSGANHSYASNRAPLQPGALIKLPIASFRPAGWLGEMLKLQRDGLTGHLGEISVWLTREGNAWLSADGKGEYGWEEVPYWLRGYARLGYVLGDQRMIDAANVWIEGTLRSQRPDGDFGPIQMRRGKRDLWAQMLMLQVLQAHYEHSGDARVLPFMTGYFKWQLGVPEDQFLKDYWENSRGGDNLASVYWLYNLTGDAFLLQLAAKIDRNTADWRQGGDLPNWHVVNIAECFRAPATYWLQSGRQADLDASYRDFALVRERYGQVPGGMFGADENARPGHTDPHQAAETCSFVEQIQSNRVMSEITGDPVWAANTEDVAFNSMPAAFTPDYRALRYLTAPNQVSSDARDHAPGVANDGPYFLMNPFSSRCCQHNHSSAWVNYTEHAWMATNDDGLAAVLYAAGELRAKAGAKGGAVTLATQTRYPFAEEISISVKDTDAGEFPLYVRIPSWAEGAAVRVNGRPVEAPVKPGGYVRLTQAWKAGDEVTLRLPMRVRVRTWAQNKSSVSIDYGPLTFSLKIDEEYHAVASEKTTQHDSGWQPGADAAKWPAHEILAGSAWNYALLLDQADPSRSFEVVRQPWPENAQPFTNAAAPILLRAKGRLLPSWTIDAHALAGALPQSPVQSDEPLTDVTLVPMGGARLRISAFPVLVR